MAFRTAFIERLGPGGFTGATFGDWLSVLFENHGAVDLKYWPRAALITFNSLVNSVARRWEVMRYGSAVEKTPVPPPIFILGAWRSGTTHLHNLLAKDDRFAFPNTYQVLYPHTFLTAEQIGSRAMQWMMPSTRPMDKVRAGVDEPQEDEFALVAVGLSFMCGLVVFPRSRNHYQKFLTLNEASPAEVERWKSQLMYFLRKLSFKYGRPLILKSPAHTGRLKVLLDLFPNAKFVHIHRDPYTVFQSTVHTWRSVKGFWGLQSDAVTEQIVLEDYARLYDAFFAERHRLGEQNFCEIRFEDLERDPIDQIKSVYRALELPAFEHVEPVLTNYVQSIAGYSRNAFPPMSREQREQVARAWSRSFEEWGYPK